MTWAKTRADVQRPQEKLCDPVAYDQNLADAPPPVASPYERPRCGQAWLRAAYDGACSGRDSRRGRGFRPARGLTCGCIVPGRWG